MTFFRGTAPLLAGLMLLSTAACSSTRSWSYTPSVRASRDPLIDKSVVIPPLIDARVNENSNMLMLYMVPLMPYGWASYQTPEGAPMHATSGTWQFQPNEDLAKAIAQELDNRQLFREAFFGFRTSEADLVLRGEIRSTDYEAKMITYGLSIYGPNLWLLLPAGTFKNELWLDLKLVDQATEDLLWTGSLRAETGSTFWIYSLASDFNYDTLLKENLPSLLAEMETAVGELDVASPPPAEEPPQLEVEVTPVGSEASDPAEETSP